MFAGAEGTCQLAFEGSRGTAEQHHNVWDVLYARVE